MLPSIAAVVLLATATLLALSAFPPIALALDAHAVSSWLAESPTGYPNWQILALALWIIATVILKNSSSVRANEPLELLANALVRVPLVGRFAAPWTTPAPGEPRTPPALPPGAALLPLALLLASCATAATVGGVKGRWVVGVPDPAACVVATAEAALAQSECDVSPPPPAAKIVECSVRAILAARPCIPPVSFVPDAAPAPAPTP